MSQAATFPQQGHCRQRLGKADLDHKDQQGVLCRCPGKPVLRLSSSVPPPSTLAPGKSPRPAALALKLSDLGDHVKYEHPIS